MDIVRRWLGPAGGWPARPYVEQGPVLLGQVLRGAEYRDGRVKLRLSGRGLPKPRGGAGDLFAVAQIVVPDTLSDRERESYQRLAESSSFQPRRHFREEEA